MRGLKFHNHMVDGICQDLYAPGCKTWKEYFLLLPDGRFNFADIYFEQSGIGLIIEVETTLRNLVSNVQKAALSELPIWVVVPTRHLREAAQRKLLRHSIPKIDFPIVCLVSEIKRQKQLFFPENLSFPYGEWSQGKSGNQEIKPLKTPTS